MILCLFGAEARDPLKYPHLVRLELFGFCELFIRLFVFGVERLLKFFDLVVLLVDVFFFLL